MRTSFAFGTALPSQLPSQPSQPPRALVDMRHSICAVPRGLVWPGRAVTDAAGEYIFRAGDRVGDNVAADRFEVQGTDVLGRGSYGVVVAALDHNTQQSVAVKLLRNRGKHSAMALYEAGILQRLRATDPADDHHVMQLLDQFTWSGHECLVCEKLGCSLLRMLTLSDFKGLQLPIVRGFARQLLDALTFLRRPDVGVIHCDIKPENVLLCEPAHEGRIKLVDFGNACFATRPKRRCIQSRWYRAPEVFLGLPYDYSADMWSVGAMLFELLCGNPLFPGGFRPLTKLETHSHDMVLRFVRLLGPIPEDQLARAADEKRRSAKPLHRECVDAADRVFQHELATHANCQCPPVDKLHDYVSSLKRTESPARTRVFAEFLEQILRFRPEERATPESALAHTFLNDDSG